MIYFRRELQERVHKLFYDSLVTYGYLGLSRSESVRFWRRQNVVAVVFTGSGSDGARGAQRVKDYDGTVFVQDPQAAEGAWMPTAAIEAMKTPFVMTLAEIMQPLIGARDIESICGKPV